MKAQYSLIEELKKNLKTYQRMSENSINDFNKNINDAPKEDKENLLNLNERLKNAMKTQDVKEALNVREELMNYLKQKNGTDNTSN
jgi:protein-arginine kinase activator protein McsA